MSLKALVTVPVLLLIQSTVASLAESAVPNLAERFCGATTADASDMTPVVALRGAERYGSDRAAEPFILAVLEGSAAWRGLRDRRAASEVISGMRAWADAHALESIEEVGDRESNTNSIYSLRRALIPLLAGWRDLSSAASPPDRSVIDAWLKRLLVIQDVETGEKASRGVGKAVSNRNNHALMRATVDALWAVEFADPMRAARSADRVRSTLADMRGDGSLPLETARGSRALWYQRHALASIVYIGERLAPLGEDIWAPRADGHTLHDAVGFLIRAIENRDLVAPYARANVDPKPGTDPGTQDVGFLWPRGHGRHYLAWVEIYRSQFPNHPHVPALEKIVRPTLELARPMIDELSGGNTTCRAFTSQTHRALPNYQPESARLFPEN